MTQPDWPDAAARVGDLQHHRRMRLAGGAVDTSEVRDLLGQLEAALDQSDLLPVFEAALQDVRPERRKS